MKTITLNNKPSGFNTPILFIIFNRPDTTARVFESIRKIRPLKLFIAADGPRKDKPGDREQCEKARAMASKIDWPCEVKTLFQNDNLGCGCGVSTAINWFFDNVEEGIIIEDDCLPDQSFFYFCRELLEKYRENLKIMHISGNNFQDGKKRGNASYYFSKYTHNWGWAAWRRSWKFNDFYCLPPEYRKHNWDKQWLLSVEKQNGLSILPNVNLVSNIGSGENATHTANTTKYSNMEACDLTFPMVHPQKIRRDIWADFYTYRNVFGGTIRSMILQKIIKITPDFLKPSLRSSINIAKKIWK